MSPTTSWGVENITVRYGPLTALDEATLRAEPGQVTGVVGGDGAGKTTLLRVLAGALRPTVGRVRRPPPSRVGYMPDRSGTYPDMSVDENLEFTAIAYGLAPRAARTRAARYLERAGLAEFRDRLAGRLSGGMRQKLGVIRAMLPGPDLLVLDEPTTGVDPVSRADLWWLVGQAAAEGTAVVFATTYVDEAERAGDLLVLERGRSLAGGMPGDIVAATPGAIVRRSERPHEDEARRAWSRRGEWRIWEPDPGGPGTTHDPGDRVEPDLQDTVTVLALEREITREPGPTGAGRSTP